MDIQAAFRISAAVNGQGSVDKLTGSVRDLGSSVDRLPTLAKAAGAAFAAIGAGAGLAIIKGQFDGVVQSLIQIKDGAEKVGTSVEGFSSLAQVARLTGESVESLEKGMVKLNRALAGTDDGSNAAAYALKAIGLSMDELRKLDPAEAFKQIAVAMDQFEDSGGKTAVAMDIFGKSGAEMILLMKDIVEFGGQASTVYSQQAEEADQYDKAVKRLTFAQTELVRIISQQLIPVATDFIGALTDVINQTGGVKDATRDLANDGSLQSFFREGARGAAALMDVLSGIVKIGAQIADSFRAVAADLEFLGTAAALINPLNGGGILFNRGAIADAFRERNATVSGINQRMVERFSGSMTPYTDALEARFAQRDVQGPQLPAPGRRSLSGFQTGGGGGSGGGGRGGSGRTEPDPFATALDSLGMDAAKFQWQTEHIQMFTDKIDSAREAQVRFDVEQGKFKDLTEGQKQVLIMAAQEVDRYADSLSKAKAALELSNQATQEITSLNTEAAMTAWKVDHIDRYGESIDSAREAQVRFDVEQGRFKDLAEGQKVALIEAAQAVDRYSERLRQAKVAMSFEQQTRQIQQNTAALGMNNIERELSVAAQELENQGIQRGTELYDQLIEKRRTAIQAATAARGDPFLGLTQGFNELADRINDRAGQMRDLLVNTFESATDALTQFVMTGKLNFRSFALSVIADLTRMIIKQQIFNLLKAGFNALAGGFGGTSTANIDSALARGVTDSAGNVLPFAKGGVVNSPTLFKFANGGALRTGLMGEAGPEAIMPLRRGPDGRLGVTAAGSGDTNVVVNVNMETGQTQSQGDNRGTDLGLVIASVVKQELINQRRPGGILAAA